MFAPFFSFFHTFFATSKNIGRSEKNLYIFGGGGQSQKNPIEKEILEKVNSNLKTTF
jgi:hypothetical protein